MAGLLLIALMAIVFWFFIVRPQRRQQQQLAATRAALDGGTEVMLASGIFGRAESLEDETVQLVLAPGVSINVARQAVARIVEPDPGVNEVEPQVQTTEDRDSDVPPPPAL